jgi:hypothetical protein
MLALKKDKTRQRGELKKGLRKGRVKEGYV